MDWLNYHHLYYFSVIAQEGGVAPAARKLRLTHSTLSTQLRALEEHFGSPLFERRGRRLVLTPFGADAASYAADIFRLGRQLNDVARGRASTGRDVLRVGVVAGMPKTLTHHLLGPALDQEGVTVQVRQDTPAALVESLVTGRLHLALTNEVPTPPAGAKLFPHALGETNVLFYARSKLARHAKRDFPSRLDGLPFVLPNAGSALRKALDAWFIERDVRPLVKAEVDDAGVLRVLGSAGRGIFPVRGALKAELEDLRDVQLLGTCEGLREKYYAMSTERRVRHRGVAAIIAGARASLLNPAR